MSDTVLFAITSHLLRGRWAAVLHARFEILRYLHALAQAVAEGSSLPRPAGTARAAEVRPAARRGARSVDRDEAVARDQPDELRLGGAAAAAGALSDWRRPTYAAAPPSSLAASSRCAGTPQ
jgi:hypothetical protein